MTEVENYCYDSEMMTQAAACWMRRLWRLSGSTGSRFKIEEE
ncbi:MAG: hypothetical protein ACLR3S_00790 [Clostridium fessum]